MKFGFVISLMGLALLGCAGIELPDAGTSQAIEPVATVREKAPVASASNGIPVKSDATPLTKEQCSDKYPIVVGQLAVRQKCVNESATESIQKFSAKQQTIILDCADMLLSLAERADRGDMAFDVYKIEKQELRTHCNTAIRMAGGTTLSGSKAPTTKSSVKAGSTAPKAQASTGKTAATKATKEKTANTATPAAKASASQPKP